MPAAPTDDYVLYADPRKMLKGLNKRMLYVGLPMVFFAWIAFAVFGQRLPLPVGHPQRGGNSIRWVKTPPQLRTEFGVIALFLTAEMTVLWWSVGRSHRKQRKPIIILSARGLTVDTLATHLEELPWAEVGEVRCYSLGYRQVGIVPTNTAALCRRLGFRRGSLLWMNMACTPLYKLFGIFVAPINIPEAYLPITAEELRAVIRTYQDAYGPPSAFSVGHSSFTPQSESTWPPPPAALG